MRTSETIIRAVVEALETTGAKILRNAELPASIPTEGLIIVRDGEPGDPFVILSPYAESYDHLLEIEVYAQGQAKSARVESLDDLIEAIGAALAVDRTFGGTAEGSWPRSPIITDTAEKGTPGVASATIPFSVSYTLTDPLS